MNIHQEISKEHHLYNDKVAINIMLNIIKHEQGTNTNSMKRQTYHHCRLSVCWFVCFKKSPFKKMLYANIRTITPAAEFRH